jgi:hypothetical protein
VWRLASVIETGADTVDQLRKHHLRSLPPISRHGLADARTLRVKVFQADDDDRPSLALDLIEGFRPMVGDQVALTAARIGEAEARMAGVT